MGEEFHESEIIFSDDSSDQSPAIRLNSTTSTKNKKTFELRSKPVNIPSNNFQLDYSDSGEYFTEDDCEIETTPPHLIGTRRSDCNFRHDYSDSNHFSDGDDEYSTEDENEIQVTPHDSIGDRRSDYNFRQNYSNSDHFSDGYGEYFTEEDDEIQITPPHIIVARRSNNNSTEDVMARSYSPLKGRNLCEFRNSVLRLTGFLES